MSRKGFLAFRGRIGAVLLALLALSLAAFTVSDAAVLGVAAKHNAAPKHKAAHHKSKPVVNSLKAPALRTPAAAVQVEAPPTLTWKAVSGAVEYEWQVSAESTFHSQIVQRALAKGTPRTYNLAAALPDNITDGTYYWRVRGVTAGGKAGPWSRARTFIKHWTATATLIAPDEQAAIEWPSRPLVMRWSTVPHAYEYLIEIATDREFANIVVGTAKSLVKTTGTAFAFQGTLPAGRYFWRVTPVDNEGHRGVRSESRSFTWSWPTLTRNQGVTNVSSGPGTYEPLFSWDPVPGAAHYEVEVSSAVNSAEEFPAGSIWCCEHERQVVGTSLSPTKQLNNNNEYYWHVRALDASGNAGQWNKGPRFPKNFDEVTPSIPGLNMITPSGDELMPPAAGLPIKTDAPIVTWSPVPGAASYEVQVTPYESECNWLSSSRGSVVTATLAWAPITAAPRIGPKAWPAPQSTSGDPHIEEGGTYCVRVLARAGNDAHGKQVISGWTYVGGEGSPAFTFAEQPPTGSPEPSFTTKSSAYGMPAKAPLNAKVTVNRECGDQPSAAEPCVRTPLFTWERVPGAVAYYVVIARDKNFTNVVDVAATVLPAYAPPLGKEEPLDDEDEAYYWAVLPVKIGPGGKVEGNLEPLINAPQSFNKSSISPQPLAPVGSVETQPSFTWTSAEGALNYTVQVSQNATFKNLLVNETTDSTWYTATSTLPAGEPLYWRVRANDANTNPDLSGLNWSEKRQFTRVLPIPTASPSNPTSSEVLPVLSWLPAPGAVAYEFAVEQPNGTHKEFVTDSTSAGPTEWDGPGVWRWKVRALFPTNGAATVPGPFSPQQPLVHRTLAPPGATGEKSGNKVVVHWNPEAYAKQYQVAVSTSETFRTTVETKRIYTNNWAPNINFARKTNRGTLYWRVAAVDGRGNVGSYSTGRFVPPKPKPKCVVKKVKRGKRTVKACVVVKHPKKKARKH